MVFSAFCLQVCSIKAFASGYGNTQISFSGYSSLPYSSICCCQPNLQGCSTWAQHFLFLCWQNALRPIPLLNSFNIKAMNNRSWTTPLKSHNKEDLLQP